MSDDRDNRNWDRNRGCKDLREARDKTSKLLDSGEREVKENGFMREPEGEKPDYTHLLTARGIEIVPPELITRIAEHYYQGGLKYEPDNWRRGTDDESLERNRRSAARHFAAWLRGETDEDHLAAVTWNMITHEINRRPVKQFAYGDTKAEARANAEKLAEANAQRFPGDAELSEKIAARGEPERCGWRGLWGPDVEVTCDEPAGHWPRSAHRNCGVILRGTADKLANRIKMEQFPKWVYDDYSPCAFKDCTEPKILKGQHYRKRPPGRGIQHVHHPVDWETGDDA